MTASEVVGLATLKILRRSDRDRSFVGTCFAVNDHMVLTCSHVVEEAEEAGAASVVDGGYQGDIGLRWAFHDRYDVAVGTVKKGTFRNWLTPVCVDLAQLESPVTCIGYGTGDKGIRSWEDRVSGQDRVHGLVTLQNSVQKGCSGGPVLDAHEGVVAMIVARDAPGATKYVLPLQSFYAWLQVCGFDPAPMGQDGGRSVTSWLLNVPIGPPVSIEQVPAAVVLAFANKLAEEGEARVFLARANALILAHNPERLGTSQITLRPVDQPPFRVPSAFWHHVFAALGMRSRRSVAALLEADGAPEARVQADDAREAFASFKRWLMEDRGRSV